MDMTQAILTELRKCGHFLHHNFGNGNTPETAEVLAALTEEEKAELLHLLRKCTQNFKAPGRTA
ncbi:MAG TPA: hypothetical protein DCZ20_01520 [Lachnospiraceae bacterium]|nr:hypothetical protein [Lachnospiraceae bacterium]